jgi:hypothetical protein
LKFLRARQWNLEEAFQVFYEALLWKSSYCGVGVDRIPEELFANELRSGKAFLYGKDKV